MSDLGEFLKHHVEGYLFEDMRTMVEALPKPGKEAGACGYPLVASAFAGIELLGGLFSPDTFDKRAGATYFREFWQGQLYPAGPKVADTLYQLVRHGLAHVYATKGDFTIVKGAAPGTHLRRDPKSGTVHIDAKQLTEDLIAAYQANVAPKVDTRSAVWRGMVARYTEMVADYKKQAAKLQGAPFPETPAGASLSTMGASGSCMPTSAATSVGAFTSVVMSVTNPPFKL